MSPELNTWPVGPGPSRAPRARGLARLTIAALLAASAGSTTAAAPQVTQAPREAGAPNRVDYEIEARYDAESRDLIGSEVIRWTNRSGVPTSELYFHLYWNAFSNNRSKFALEGGSAHGRGEWGWQRVTSVEVDGADVFDTFTYVATDALQVPVFTEGEPFVVDDDRTVFKVELKGPVQSGETAEIRVNWSARVPHARRRTGYKGDFLLIAQWFPKLGVFEGADGWNCHQFHNSTEFFSDYGTYRVTLDLPADYEGKVGGSGVQVGSRKKEGDRLEVIYEAPSVADRERADMFGKLPVVHDFTWTGDPKYVPVEFHFDYAEWAAKSAAHSREVERVQAALGPDVDVSLRGVDVTVLIHPERRSQAERHYEATANALFFYGLWFGEYPYEHITVVDPVWGDNRAGGMEYPTLFTCGTGLFTTPDMYKPESVTVHEAGHQFWYGLVGNNEFEASWLDEGFNSFTDSEVMIRAYGPQRSTTSYSRYPFDGVRQANLPAGGRFGDALNARRLRWNFSSLSGIPVLELIAQGDLAPLRSSGPIDWWRDQPYLTLVSRWDDPRWGDRSSYLRNPVADPIDRPAWTYVDRRSYRTNSYQRPAVALRSLIGVVTYEDFLKGMREFAKTWRYRHPYPQDFFDTFSEAIGQDLSWYFEDAFRSTKTIDWSVSVSQTKPKDPSGWFQGEGGEFEKYEKPKPDGEGAADAAEPEEGGEGVEEVVSDEASEEEEDATPTKPWAVEITLRREGELCLPLPWRVIYDDDTHEDQTWSREAQLEQPWKKYRAENQKKIKAVVLDPERAYYFDRNMSDNQWYATGDEVAPLRWTERVLNQYGHLIHWYAGIGG